MMGNATRFWRIAWEFCVIYVFVGLVVISVSWFLGGVINPFGVGVAVAMLVGWWIVQRMLALSVCFDGETVVAGVILSFGYMFLFAVLLFFSLFGADKLLRIVVVSMIFALVQEVILLVSVKVFYWVRTHPIV